MRQHRVQNFVQIFIVFLCIAVAVFGLRAFPMSDPLTIWVLAMCLLLFALESWPAEQPREKLLIPFSLPTLCGLWTACGSWTIVIGPAAAALALPFVWNRAEPLARERSVLRVLVMGGVLAVATGSANLVSSAMLNSPLRLPIAVCAFFAASISTGLLVWLVHSGPECYRTVHRMLSHAIWDWVVIACVLLIGSLAMAAAVAQAEIWLLPIAATSTIALRVAFARRGFLNFHRQDSLTLLLSMMQRAHPFTHGHIERVAKMAEEVALRMGLNPAVARKVSDAAVLHDIGKIAVDEAILDIPGPLTEEQMKHVRRHAVVGGEILDSSPDFSEIASWVRHHHERPDGTGYPNELRDYEIEIPSKIIAVTDAYDAMVGGNHPNQKRPYRITLTPLEALDELEKCSGSQFDPKVVAAFRQTISAQGALQ